MVANPYEYVLKNLDNKSTYEPAFPCYCQYITLDRHCSNIECGLYGQPCKGNGCLLYK
jgi:hypothetical protein